MAEKKNRFLSTTVYSKSTVYVNIRHKTYRFIVAFSTTVARIRTVARNIYRTFDGNASRYS